MNEETQKPKEITIPAEKVTIINIDDIKPNTVLVINIDVNTPEEKMACAPAFGKLLAPYAAILKEKRVTVMLMSTKENISQISEEEMANFGWEKKGKSLIINPYEKSDTSPIHLDTRLHR